MVEDGFNMNAEKASVPRGLPGQAWAGNQESAGWAGWLTVGGDTAGGHSKKLKIQPRWGMKTQAPHLHPFSQKSAISETA